MFRRLDKFDEPIFGGEGGAYIQGGLIFGMLIGLHIWGVYILGGGGVIYKGKGGHVKGILRYASLK